MNKTIVCQFNATHVRFSTAGGCAHAVDAAAPRCRESFTACASPPGRCSPPLARWIHVNRRRMGFCGWIPFTITSRRLLPVQVAPVGRRDFKFTIPYAFAIFGFFSCNATLPHRRTISFLKRNRRAKLPPQNSELAAAATGQGLQQRKIQGSQDVQWPCTAHLL